MITPEQYNEMTPEQKNKLHPIELHAASLYILAQRIDEAYHLAVDKNSMEALGVLATAVRLVLVSATELKSMVAEVELAISEAPAPNVPEGKA